MFIEAKQTRVYYEIQGEAPSRVLLLHGWGCDHSFFNSLREALVREHQVLTLDFPGFGQSGRPPEPWGVPEYAECLREALEKIGFLPCAALGHSFGCRVLAWAGSEWPEMFTRLVFTGAAGLRDRPDPKARKKSEAYRRKRDALRKMARIPFLRRAEENLEEKLRQKYGSADYNALDAEMRAIFVKVVNLDLRDRYPRLKAPTLLIWGDEDRETPLWMGQEMEKLIPDAGLVLLEGGSHFAFLEQAGRFNAIVYHFFSEA